MFTCYRRIIFALEDLGKQKEKAFAQPSHRARLKVQSSAGKSFRRIERPVSTCAKSLRKRMDGLSNAFSVLEIDVEDHHPPTASSSASKSSGSGIYFCSSIIQLLTLGLGLGFFKDFKRNLFL